jgi:hypothetical protein
MRLLFLEAERRVLEPGIFRYRNFALQVISLMLWLGVQSSGFAGDVTFYSVEKGTQYFQTNSDLPTIEVANGFFFEANVKLAASNSVTSASVQSAGGTIHALTPQTPTHLTYKKSFNTQSKLDKAERNGPFTLTLSTAHDGTKVVSLALEGDVYPKPAHLQNFAAAQEIDTSNSFTLIWDPFAGGTATDFIHVRIENGLGDKIFESPDFGKRGAMNGTNTQVVVPGQTLMTGETYNVILTFQKIIVSDQTSYSPASGIAAYDGKTSFIIATKASENPPYLSSGQWSTKGQFEFHLAGTAGRSYRIDASTDLRQWLPISTNTPSSGGWDFLDTESMNLSSRFYRAVLAQ